MSNNCAPVNYLFPPNISYIYKINFNNNRWIIIYNPKRRILNRILVSSLSFLFFEYFNSWFLHECTTIISTFSTITFHSGLIILEFVESIKLGQTRNFLAFIFRLLLKKCSGLLVQDWINFDFQWYYISVV